MSLKLLVLAVLITIVKARLRILVDIDQDKNTVITHSGKQADIITDEDVKLFKIGNQTLNEAVLQHIGKKPKNVYLNSPTPGGDWYKKYDWQQVTRVITIKSAKVTSFFKSKVRLHSVYYKSLPNITRSVPIGLTYDKDSILTTNWTKDNGIRVSEDIKHEFLAVFTDLKGVSGFFFTPGWGFDEKISQVYTLGAALPQRCAETEVKPGYSLIGELNGYYGLLDVEVEYSISLIGNLTFQFKKPYKDQRLWALLIQDVMKSGNISNEITTVEKIQLEYFTDSDIKIETKEIGQN